MSNPVAQPNQTHPTGRTVYGFDGTTLFPIEVTASGSLGVIKTDVRNTETIQELYAAASIAGSTQVLAATLAVSGVKRATFFILHGRAGSAAFGTNGTEYRIEGSAASSGNNSWVSLASVLAASAVAQTLAASSNVAVGDTTVTILSGTAVTLGDLILWPSGGSGSTEWVKVASISGTASFTVLDGFTNAHAAASGLIAGAEPFCFNLNVEAMTRVRAVINNNASGTTQAIYSRIACITEK